MNLSAYRAAPIAATVLLVAACSTGIERGEALSRKGEWDQAAKEFREEAVRDPSSVEARSLLKQAEIRAADQHYHRGQGLLAKSDLDGAIAEFQAGLATNPGFEKLQQALTSALALKEADALYGQAKPLQAAGKFQEAGELLTRALELNPAHAAARALAKEVARQANDAEGREFANEAHAPITLNLRQADARSAFEFLGKSFGVNVMFEEGFRSGPITLFARNVKFEEGLALLLQSSKAFYRKVGSNAIVIISDTKDKRAQYEDHVVHVIYLNTARAKEMADLLKSLFPLRRMIVNEQLNSLTIRDTEEMIALARKTIEVNDRKPAEILLEVEILEINRNKAERLGLDLGSYSIGVGVTNGQVPASGSISEAIKTNALVSIPSATLRLFKQEVGAKTLANPKVRTLNGRPAKIHIGDRVPLRSSTIQDVTGQVRTTFDYRDIGIRLNVEPIIHLDNSSTVKLALEVSTLGENRGTPTEPAYAIGTRNAETVMVLRDGETAVLGGLIRDAERRNRLKVPGIGDIPAAGTLFTSYDDAEERTDVLLTITPRVVRGWDIVSAKETRFFSGTESAFSMRPIPPPLTLASTDATATSNAKPGADRTPAAPAADVPAKPAAANLRFDKPLYEVSQGQEVEIAVQAHGVPPGALISTEVLFNPQIMGFVRGEVVDASQDGFKVQAAPTPGVLRISAKAPQSGTEQGVVLARMVMRAETPGISYVIQRSPTASVGATPTTLETQPSRVAVK